MTEFFIPTNFEDSGKLAGLFNIRNVIEAGILSLPFVYPVFKLVPVGLTWKIILSAVFAIPVGGFADVCRQLADEAYKAQRYLSQCELGVIDITDNGQLIDLLYGFINKQSAKHIKPGNFISGMFDETHTYEGGTESEE